MPDVLSAPTASLEHLRQEVDRLHELHAAAVELSASLELDELLPLVLERMRSAVAAQAGTLWVAESEGMFRCRAGLGEVGDRLKGAARRWDDVVAPATSRAAGEPETTILVPLVAAEETVGAVLLSAKAGGAGVVRPGRPRAAEGARPARRPCPAQRPAPEPGPPSRGYHAHPRDQPRDHRDPGPGPGAPSVVNLASRALTFDRGAVALYDKGKCEIRAVAGQETVDQKDPEPAGPDRAGRLGRRPRRDALPDATATSRRRTRSGCSSRSSGRTCEAASVSSGLYLPLKDEEGMLGVLRLRVRHRPTSPPSSSARPAGDPGQPDGGGPAERAAL